MRPDDPFTPIEREHGRAASATALALIAALFRHGQRSAADLALATGLDLPVVQAGLRGLQARGRVTCEGKGPHPTWRLSQHSHSTLQRVPA